MAAKKEEKAQGSQIRTLLASEIECRVGTMKQNGCSLLLYKDARVDMKILDETVGVTGWKRSHVLINGNLFCNVEIWDADKYYKTMERARNIRQTFDYSQIQF
mgnify:CR=1 FL=1